MVGLRAVGAATVFAALVACGSGVPQASTASSLLAPSSPHPASASSPVASWPNPAASNFSVPPAISVPWVSLVYVQHGVALVGVSPIGGGDESGQPSTLWLSTDLAHWREVTPPASRQPFEGNQYVTFDQASFLSPSTGWVTTWNSWNLGVTIYRTADGGKNWTTAPTGSGHGDHGGDADWIQLLSPTVAFRREHRRHGTTHVAVGYNGRRSIVERRVQPSARGRIYPTAGGSLRHTDALHFATARVRCHRDPARGRRLQRRVLPDHRWRCLVDSGSGPKPTDDHDMSADRHGHG